MAKAAASGEEPENEEEAKARKAKDAVKQKLMKKAAQDKAKVAQKTKVGLDDSFSDIECMMDILDYPIINDCAEAFKKTFEHNKTLIHVDLSYNGF